MRVSLAAPNSLYRHVCRHVHGHVLEDMRVDMRVDIRRDMCADMRADMCALAKLLHFAEACAADMCTAMCMRMRTGARAGMFVGTCVDRRAAHSYRGADIFAGMATPVHTVYGRTVFSSVFFKSASDDERVRLEPAFLSLTSVP